MISFVCLNVNELNFAIIFSPSISCDWLVSVVVVCAKLTESGGHCVYSVSVGDYNYNCIHHLETASSNKHKNIQSKYLANNKFNLNLIVMNILF